MGLHTNTHILRHTHARTHTHTQSFFFSIIQLTTFIDSIVGNSFFSSSCLADERFGKTPAGLNGFIMAMASFPPAANSTGRDGGLSPSEIALLPVRRYVAPSASTSTSTAVVSTAHAGAATGMVKAAACCRRSGSGGVSVGGLEVELPCARMGDEEGESRSHPPPGQRLLQGQFTFLCIYINFYWLLFFCCYCCCYSSSSSNGSICRRNSRVL